MANPPKKKYKIKNGLTVLPPIEEYVFQQWRKSLPSNLQNDTPDYDLRGAWTTGIQPELFYRNKEGKFQSAHPIDVNEPGNIYQPHLFSNDPNTGRYLKAPTHDSYLHAIEGDIKAGYTPYMDVKTGLMYAKKFKYGSKVINNENTIDPPKKKYVSKTQGTRLDDGTYVTPIAEVKGYKTPANAVREGTGNFAKSLFSGTNLATEVMGTPLALALETLSGRGDYKSALPNLDRSNKMFGLSYDKNNLPQNEQLSPSTALGITNPFISVPIDLAADLVTGKLSTSGKNIGKNLLKNKIPNQINSSKANNLLNVSGLFDVNQNQLPSNPTNLSPIDDLHISHKNDMYSFFYNVDEEIKNKINTIYNDNYNALENINDKIERQKLAAYLTTRDNKLKNNSVFNVEDIKEKSMSELTNDEIEQLREKIGFNPPSVELLNKFHKNPKEKIKDLIPLAKPLEEAKYTPEELLAGRRYTRGFDQQLNLVNRLRGGSNEFFWDQKDKLLANPKPIKKAIFEDANILQNAILKQKFAEDINLYRNIQGNVHVIDAQGNKVVRPSVYAMNVGDIIEEKGFMSTSINPESFGSTGKLSINAPAKKQSFYQPNQNLNSSEFITEYEALLPKGIKLQYTGNKDIKGNPIMNIMNPYMKTGIVATAGLLGSQMLQEKPTSYIKYNNGGRIGPDNPYVETNDYVLPEVTITAPKKKEKYNSSLNPFDLTGIVKNNNRNKEKDSVVENIMELIDPTGRLSHDDAQRAYNEYKQSKRILPNFDQALDMFSAVPALGRFGKFRYIANLDDLQRTGSNVINLVKPIYKLFPWQDALNTIGTSSDVLEDNVSTKKSKPKSKYGSKVDKLYKK